MTDTTSKLQTALNSLNPAYLDLQDDSASHAGHAGNTGGSHYTVTIVSEAFNDLALIKRHRLVYEAVGDLMTNDIHALSIKAKTPAEYGLTL
jgi:BolA protein